MTSVRRAISQKTLDKGSIPKEERKDLKQRKLTSTKCLTLPVPKGKLTIQQRLAFNQLCRSLMAADVLNEEDVYTVEKIAVCMLAHDPVVARFCGLSKLPTERTLSRWLGQFDEARFKHFPRCQNWWQSMSSRRWVFDD